MSDSVTVRLEHDEAEGLRALAGRLNLSTSEIVRSTVRATTRQRPVYGFDGTSPHSFVRDLWAVEHPMDVGPGEASEARDRVRAFNAWRQEAAPLFIEATRFAANTTNAGTIVEPQYKPLLADFTEDRPLFDVSEKGRISNATPFTLPGSVTAADVDGAVDTHTEGTNPPEGDLTFGPVTVTPAGISGVFKVTREIVDSSNPAIDAIALTVMRQSFARQSEARLFTALNAAQAGTITTGHVPSGAMARTSATTALPDDLRATVAAYTDTAGRRPRAAVASSRPSVAEELAALDDASAAGSDEFWRVGNTPVFLSPQVSGTAAGDGDVFVLGSGVLFSWASPLLELRYFERSGPAVIDLSLWGYFAGAVLDPRGVASIRHT